MVYISVENLRKFLEASGCGTVFGVSKAGYLDCFLSEREGDGVDSYALYSFSKGEIQGTMTGCIYFPGTEPPYVTEAAEAGYRYIDRNSLPVSGINNDDEGAPVSVVTVESLDVRGMDGVELNMVFSSLSGAFMERFSGSLVVWPSDAGWMPKGGEVSGSYTCGFLSTAPLDLRGDVLIL